MTVSGAPNENVLAIGCAGADRAAAGFSAAVGVLSVRVDASARAVAPAAGLLLSASALSAFALSALRRDRSAAWRDSSASFVSANLCVSRRGVGATADVGGTTVAGARSWEGDGNATGGGGVVVASSLT